MATATLVPTNGNGQAGHDELLWLAPSPLWDDGGTGVGAPEMDQPRLVELTTDRFADEFLAYLAGTDPNQEGPAGLGAHAPADGSGTMDDPLVLYQALHQRFYFVVGSLVCRRVGLPDRTVAPRGEALSFVFRRLVTRTGPGGAEITVEQAWLANSSAWIDVPDANSLLPGEEQHSMQTATVDAPSATGPAAELLGLDEPGRRQVHFGYVPVDGRTSRPATMSDADALAALQAADSGAGVGDDPRIMSFRLRISEAWKDLASRKDVALAASKPVSLLHLEIPSLYVLLELADWLGTYLPTVRTHLINNTAVPGGGAREELRQLLDKTIQANGAGRRLGQAMGEVLPFLPLLQGDQSVGMPSTTYDLAHGSGRPEPFDDFLSLTNYLKNEVVGISRNFGGKVHAALVQEDADANGTGAPPAVPPELSGMIVARPATGSSAQLEDRHVIRLVYEHEPCAPLLSKPSAVLRLAGVYDPDAPARKVRIQVPDPINMRRFNRGVAIEMPPNLRKILDGVTPKILKEEPLEEGGGWGVGMICSFSFQIFMILSFIIAFIFLILLNIVFWWMFFIKICFPIPVKKDQGGP